MLGKSLNCALPQTDPLGETMHVPKKNLVSPELLALVAYFFELQGFYGIQIWTQQFLIIMWVC